MALRSVWVPSYSVNVLTYVWAARRLRPARMPNITKPGRFLILLTVLIVVAFFLVSLEVPEDVGGLRAQVVYVWKEAEPLVVVSAVVALIVVEGWSMLAEKYLRERYRKGREEGREEERKAWREWNDRRILAERSGRPFTEPPPSNQEDPKPPDR